MSREQAQRVEALLRNGPLDLGGPLGVQRPLLEDLMTGHPLPDGVELADGALGGVPVVEAVLRDTQSEMVLVYVHGGAYALGSARGGAGLAAELAVRTGTRAISIEYRLAPEHPAPAALDDVTTAYRALLEQGLPAERIVLVGESAGGGLALAALLALRDTGTALPAAAVLLSPWTDLTLAGSSIRTRAHRDAALTERALRTRAADYVAGGDPADPTVSPLLGDHHGLPPLLIQVGGNEILLDDALRLAAAAATADVPTVLQVTPHMPHVFQGFAAAVVEGATALDEAARFITTHLDRKAD